VNSLRRTGRSLAIGVRTHVLHMSRSPLEILLAVTLPLVYATLAIYLFGVGDHPLRLSQAAIGAGLMGMWSSVLVGSGGAVQDQRGLGVLEILVAAPTRLIMVLLPITIASAVIGVYSMVAVVVWSALLFGVVPVFAHPLLFLVALPVCMLSLGMMGLLLASVFVLTRNANALANALDYPVWLLSGVLTPITVLPAWTQPVSWLLPTTWGAAAVNLSVSGDTTRVVLSMVAAVALGAGYLVLAKFALSGVERRARSSATLALT
jgi:ABC-2 type transport system permease protein